MNKVIFILILYIASFTTSFASSNTSHIENARLSLKNYGLVNCLYHGLIKEQDIRVEDIGRSSGVFGPIGQGYYDFLQDDELNILHNPYKTIRDFIKKNRKLVSANMKDGTVNLTYQCLAVFNSSEYLILIEQQDPYITKEYDDNEPKI